VLATLHKVDAKKRLQVLVWWAGFLGLLALLVEPEGAAAFVLLWLAARATVYHFVKIFAEISDHVGLVPGSIIGYTRNLPSNWLSFFMHPHHDNYHLTHHLFPRVPLVQLPRMHQMLMEVGLYTQAHHGESYFLGEASVVRSWIQPESEPEPEPVSIRSVSA
jgi:fatty acid desaturase